MGKTTCIASDVVSTSHSPDASAFVVFIDHLLRAIEPVASTSRPDCVSSDVAPRSVVKTAHVELYPAAAVLLIRQRCCHKHFPARPQVAVHDLKIRPEKCEHRLNAIWAWARICPVAIGSRAVCDVPVGAIFTGLSPRRISVAPVLAKEGVCPDPNFAEPAAISIWT